MKIAIIGSGISGLGAAYLLDQKHEITIYEKNSYLGGHSRTVNVETDLGKTNVDTGFIVFNDRNYPLLTGLFRHLGVEIEKSDMSFGVSISNTNLEYATKNFNSFFAQKKNLINPHFGKMIFDILKFNRKAKAFLNSKAQLTLGQYLNKLKMGEWFKNYYLLPMGGAIWSSPIDQMLEFPAKTFVRFFYNHGLLSMSNHPQWYTVKGGSKEYVTLLTKGFKEKIKLNCGVHKVYRSKGKVSIENSTGEMEEYDQVVFSCHADQALRMLDNPTNDEKNILDDFSYQDNKIILHSDLTFMPKNRKCWASWVYLSDSLKDNNRNISLSYWMNQLQNQKCLMPLIITLNPNRTPKSHLIHDSHNFSHPIFDFKAIESQKKLENIQGKSNSWFCGAYQRYGFHEDGLWSAVSISKKLGVGIPWK